MKLILIGPLLFHTLPLEGVNAKLFQIGPFLCSCLPIGGRNAKLFLIGPFYFMPSHWRA